MGTSADLFMSVLGRVWKDRERMGGLHEEEACELE